MRRLRNKSSLSLALMLACGCVGCERFSGGNAANDSPTDGAVAAQPADRAVDTVDAGAEITGRTAAAAAPTTPTTAAAAAQPGDQSATRQAQEADEAEYSRLYGTWVAQDVDSKIGEVKIQLTFSRHNSVRILAWSELPLVGQVRKKQAPFEITDHTIHSDAIRGGTTVEYRFDQGDLIIEYKEGKTVRFERKS